MSNETKTIDKFSSETQLKTVLASTYMKQINNYFGDEKKSLRFLSSVVSAVQRNKDLLACTPTSVINSFMTMAQLELMPSDVSGEAYVIPYAGSAQFQLGYQGIITLLYRAGMQSINADIVYENDEFEYQSGMSPTLIHKPKVFKPRGEAIGCYAVATLPSGERVFKVLSKEDVMKFKNFSKSKNSTHTPWDSKNDPELHMWRKTAIKQLAKFLPKNAVVFQAFAEDNKDSVIADRIESAKKESESLTMGNLLQNEKNQESSGEENQDEAHASESDEIPPEEDTIN